MDTPMRNLRWAPLLVTLSFALTAALPAQERTGAESAAAPPPIPLYDGLGTYSRKVRTAVPLAQQYFDQGMRLTYGFGLPAARRSFRAAIAADSSCAMCWWGLAWSLGPYINGTRMDSTREKEAYDAAQRARALAASSPANDRALIEAMTTRYRARPDTSGRAVFDSAYANAMRDVARRHRDDLDASSLLGEALMVLRPWDHWTRTGEPKPGTEEVIAVLEGVLERNLRHPGACHHYIHATEASRTPERAAACADILADIIPGASHIPHMPSHTYMRMGRYGDAVRFNQRAWMADQRAQHDGAPGIYPEHNLDMLRSAATMDGQSGIALQAVRDMARLSPFGAIFQMLTMVRFGRWAEILATPVVYRDEMTAGFSSFAHGLAYLGTGESMDAEIQLGLLDAMIRAVPDTAMFGDDPLKNLLGMARGILAGEIAASQKKWDDAVTALRGAVVLEDSLKYAEPEFWPLPVRHVLGAVLLEAGRPAEAEAVYREELQVHKGNGWSLFGLTQALRAQGRHADAEKASRDFATAFARADIWMTGSRFRPAPVTPPRPPGAR